MMYKKKYQNPTISSVELDKEIVLVMASRDGVPVSPSEGRRPAPLRPDQVQSNRIAPQSFVGVSPKF